MRSLLAILFFAVTASAATTSVPAGDVAALVAAIDAANVAPGDDTIVLAAGSTYSLTAANNSPTWGPNGLPVVTSTITIQGNGAIIERSASASVPFRLLGVDTASGNLTIDQVTLRKGTTQPGGDGAAIHVRDGTLKVTASTLTDNHCDGLCLGGAIHHNVGHVEITDSTLSNNSATEGGAIETFTSGELWITRSRIVDNVVSHPTQFTDGGGIAATGYLVDIRIVDSTISGNQAVGPTMLVGALGGGIADQGGSLWHIERSTISGNSVTVSDGNAAGGGIYEGGAATFTILNSTITGNHCTTPSSDGFRYASGGGIEAQGGGTWTLNNVTIAGNTVTAGNGAVPRGSGIGIEDVHTMTIRNSIVGGNAGSPDCFTLNAEEAITSGGHNLFQDTTGCTITAGTGDVSGQSPQLGLLADNGGPTQTLALSTGPALEAGDPATPGSGGNACETTDQRGLCRPGGTTCDIGAYEKDGFACSTTTLVPSTTTTTLPNGQCAGVPTFVDIDCRLDLLVAMTESAQDLGRLKKRLVKVVTKARSQKQKAEMQAASNVKKAKKNLRKAAHTMRSFVHGFKSLSARKLIPEATRNAFLGKAEPISADMSTLLSTL